GGLVLSELLSFGIPAVLVPLPHAADGHQDANAQYLASIGAATVLNQNRLSGLTAVVKSLMDDERRRLTMQAAALAAARPDAAVTVANEVLQCLAA
ncbi:MAG: glycosyltransferase, partial [candidate division WOR-3 bacterium]